MNKKADINWEMVALIIAIVVLIVLVGIVLFSRGTLDKLLEMIKNIVSIK